MKKASRITITFLAIFLSSFLLSVCGGTKTVSKENSHQLEEAKSSADKAEKELANLKAKLLKSEKGDDAE